MDLNELRIYKMAMRIGDKVWEMTMKWDFFERKTIGSQLVRSADSIAANIAEGFGRFHYKESKNFYYYERGSLYETQTWLKKAERRDLISHESHHKIQSNITDLGVKLNNFITSIGNKENQKND